MLSVWWWSLSFALPYLWSMHWVQYQSGKGTECSDIADLIGRMLDVGKDEGQAEEERGNFSFQKPGSSFYAALQN